MHLSIYPLSTSNAQSVMCIHVLISAFLFCTCFLSDDFFLQIVGAENPVLMSAAEQIFGAGGKRMRPALVFLVSRATAEIVGLK